MSDTMAFRFPASIYPKHVIRQAIVDYGHICKIELTCEQCYCICTFSDSVVDLQMTAREFSNYLIELASVSSAR